MRSKPKVIKEKTYLQLNLISHGKVVWLILKAGIFLSNYSINQLFYGFFASILLTKKVAHVICFFVGLRAFSPSWLLDIYMNKFDLCG